LDSLRDLSGSTKTPLFFSQRFHQPTSSITSSTSFRAVKMSQYCFHGNTNSFNKVLNNCTVADDRPQILTWLSPLEPRLQHKEIQERRVENVGRWVLETEEFRSWHGSSRGSGSDSAVLFYYGHPGVGKTFIR